MNLPAKCQQMSSGVPEFMAKKRSRGHPTAGSVGSNIVKRDEFSSITQMVEMIIALLFNFSYGTNFMLNVYSNFNKILIFEF